MEALQVSLGVGPDLALALVRFGDGWRLRIEVGGDQVADEPIDLAVLRRFIFDAIDEPI